MKTKIQRIMSKLYWEERRKGNTHSYSFRKVRIKAIPLKVLRPYGNWDKDNKVNKYDCQPKNKWKQDEKEEKKMDFEEEGIKENWKITKKPNYINTTIEVKPDESWAGEATSLNMDTGEETKIINLDEKREMGTNVFSTGMRKDGRFFHTETYKNSEGKYEGRPYRHVEKGMSQDRAKEILKENLKEANKIYLYKESGR